MAPVVIGRMAATEEIEPGTWIGGKRRVVLQPVSYTHLRAHETVLDLVCRLLLEKKNKQHYIRAYTRHQYSN